MPLEILGTLNTVLLPAAENNNIHCSRDHCFTCISYCTVKLCLIPSTAVGIPIPCLVG